MARGGAREAELTARWAAGAWCGETLATGDGEMYTVHYQGRRGGGAGPDFRDAVLLRADGHRVIGDIELHLRASGWRAHGHQRDPRYNGVVLHVALAATPHDAATPGAPLASGRFARCRRAAHHGWGGCLWSAGAPRRSQRRPGPHRYRYPSPPLRLPLPHLWTTANDALNDLPRAMVQDATDVVP